MGAPRGRRWWTLPSIGAAALVLAAPAVAAAVQGGGPAAARSPAAGSPAAGSRVVAAWATYYGWYDNTPPGCATAYSGCARGTGTAANPITFASDRKEFPVGTLLYYPTVQKYFVMGDDCQECDLDWSGKGPDGGPHFRHVDLWIGGRHGNEFAAINCEDALTQGTPAGAPIQTPFIVNPPKNLPVSTEPLFDARTGHCFGGATTSWTRGRYRNAAAGKCLGIRGAAGGGGPAALLGCRAAPADTVTFDGAFLILGHHCLETVTGRYGSSLTFAACNGSPREQWSVNPDGTIAWVQYTRCVADVAGRLQLSRCTRTAADTWVFAAA